MAAHSAAIRILLRCGIRCPLDLSQPGELDHMRCGCFATHGCEILLNGYDGESLIWIEIAGYAIANLMLYTLYGRNFINLGHGFSIW